MPLIGNRGVGADHQTRNVPTAQSHDNDRNRHDHGHRQQRGGDASELTDAQGFAARRSSQRQQQYDEACDADEPVKRAEHRPRRAALGSKLQCRQYTAENGGAQQQSECQEQHVTREQRSYAADRYLSTHDQSISIPNPGASVRCAIPFFTWAPPR